MEFSDIAKQGRIASVGIAGRFGERLNADFKISKTKEENDKRNRAVINPRWFGKHLFVETTARNSIDFMKARQRKPEGKRTISTGGQLKRLRSQARQEGRATF